MWDPAVGLLSQHCCRKGIETKTPLGEDLVSIPFRGVLVSPDQVGTREGFMRFGCLIKADIGEANIK